MTNDFKGFKHLLCVQSQIIEALTKLILNGEEIRLTGTITDGQVLMRVLDGDTHYWTNRTPEFPEGPDITDKADKSTTLTGTSPIQIDGGTSGDLSANRTISILAATEEAAGSLSAEDKVKLNNVPDNTVQEFEDINSAINVLATSINTLRPPIRIHLKSGGSTGDVGTRISGLVAGVDYPTGWVLTVGSTPTSLTVTHNLGAELSGISVWSIDQISGKRQEMKGDLGYVALYSALDMNSFEIDSLAGVPRELYIYIKLY